MLSSKVSEFKPSAVLASLMSSRAYSRRASRSDSVRPDGVVGEGVDGGSVWFRATMRAAAAAMASAADTAIQTNRSLRRGELFPCLRGSKFRLNVNS